MNYTVDLATIRKSYSLRELNETSVAPDPYWQFNAWLQEAMEAAVPEPTAMVLATADQVGVPSARVVLLKGITAEGFIFFF